MKNTKRIVSILTVLILVTTLFGCGKDGYEITHQYDEIYGKEDVTLEVREDSTFTVFKINDTHLYNGTCDSDESTLSVLKTALDNSSFDLIIVDGDLVDGYNSKLTYNKYKAVSKFAELIESYNVPWTFAPGNNDGEKDGTNEELIAFMMQYNHFLCGNEKGTDGSMQFFIDLTSKGEVVHSIAVMDSLSTNSDDKYDSIKQSQIDWLMSEINSRDTKTSVFFHMPTPAFKTAYEEGVPYDGYPFSDEYAVDDIKENKLFDDAIGDNEKISLVSVGHVHSDNIAYYDNNRYYQLSSLGGYNAAGSQNTPPSYTLIKIHTDEPDTTKMYEFSKIGAE